MKKIILLIISIAIILTSALPQQAMAIDTKKWNAEVVYCADAFVLFKESIETVDVEAPYKGKYALNFRIHFETVRTNYHNLVKCVFDSAAAEILGSAAGDTSGMWSANSPNLTELLKPEATCLAEDKMAEILTNAGPANLLSPMLALYNEYKAYLTKLYKEKDKHPRDKDENEINFAEISKERNFLKQLVENEIQDSIVALDGAFNGLKELRSAFVMHVHFQCMLKHLEHYRRALENLRSIMWIIPELIEDASKT